MARKYKTITPTAQPAPTWRVEDVETPNLGVSTVIAAHGACMGHTVRVDLLLKKLGQPNCKPLNSTPMGLLPVLGSVQGGNLYHTRYSHYRHPRTFCPVDAIFANAPT